MLSVASARACIFGMTLVVVSTSCTTKVDSTSASPSSPAATAARIQATPVPHPSIVRRPTPIHGDPPTVLGALADAGTFVFLSGRYRYDGAGGTVEAVASADPPREHPAPLGALTALERQTRTAGGFWISNELAVRDGAAAERVIYRAPEMFYWSGWSPDGRYIALWEVDFFSGSIDLDGRPLLVIDATSGAKVDLGWTLLNGTTAWTGPHTLAFVSGRFRDVFGNKALRLWSPENGVSDVTAPGTAALAPVWSADGRRLYFVTTVLREWTRGLL